MVGPITGSTAEMPQTSGTGRQRKRAIS